MKNSGALTRAAIKIISKPRVAAGITKAASAAAPVVLETAIVLAPAVLAGYGVYYLIKKISE